MTDFNHEGRVSLVYMENKPCLKQDGKIFSNAEYNRTEKRWLPEPKLIDSQEIYEGNRQELMGILQHDLCFPVSETIPDGSG